MAAAAAMMQPLAVKSYNPVTELHAPTSRGESQPADTSLSPGRSSRLSTPTTPIATRKASLSKVRNEGQIAGPSDYGRSPRRQSIKSAAPSRPHEATSSKARAEQSGPDSHEHWRQGLATPSHRPRSSRNQHDNRTASGQSSTSAAQRVITNAAASQPYSNLLAASLSTPELHLASDPLLDGDVRIVQTPHDAFQAFAWPSPATGVKRSHDALAGTAARLPHGPLPSLGSMVDAQPSFRERKHSTATLRREPLAGVQSSHGSCSSSATIQASPNPDEFGSRTTSATNSPQSTPSRREEKQRSSVGRQEPSFRHPRTWFNRPRRWSTTSKSSLDANSTGDSPGASPSLASNGTQADAVLGKYSPATHVSGGTASSSPSAGRHSGTAEALEVVRGARAFLVAELGRLSTHAMGEDRERIASLAWYARQQEAEADGVAIESTREMREFCVSISDGVVLCLVANLLRPGSVDVIDRRPLEWVKADNISRFLRAAREAFGLCSRDLFHPLDLTDGTIEGLQRAAETILEVQRRHEAASQHVIEPSASTAMRTSSSSGRTTDVSTPPLTPDGSLDDRESASIGRNSAVPFPPGIDGSPHGSPSKRNSSSRSGAYAGMPLSVQQQREEAERILVSASATKVPLTKDAQAQGRRRRSSDRSQSLLSASRPAKGPSITFADSVTMRVSDEESRMPYRDRKLSESAVSLTGVAEEESEEILYTPIVQQKPAMQSTAFPTADEPGDRVDPYSDSPTSPRSGAANATMFGSASLARPEAQRRISQELSFGGNGSPGRPLRSSSEFDEFRFPTNASPLRQTPVRRHSARSFAGPSSLNPSRDSPTLEPVAGTTLANTGSGAPSRVPFPRAHSTNDSPSVKRIGRHLSLNTGIASYDSTVGSSSGYVPTSPKLGPRPNYRHMRYSSDLHVPRSAIPLGQTDGAADRTPALVAPPLSAQPSRSRYDSEMGSMYSNTLASYSTEDAFSMQGNGSRLSREASVAPATKHKLVVSEAGKANVSYQLGNCIGRGQFGSVYRALNLNSGQMMAVKRIKLAGKTEDEVTQLMNEVDLLKSLAHPSVVKYEGLVRGEDVVSIILEYVENGSLLHTLKAFGNFPEKLVASYVVKILEGLNYLHDMKVVHCDLKAANILTTKNGNVKLSDFGVSLNLKAVEAIKNVKNDAIGTPNWMAPEVIELKGASTAADIWSLGCTIIELLTGKPPYGDMLAMSAMWRIVEDDCPPLPDEISPLLRDFLLLCFNKDPAKRPSAEMLFEHTWLQQTWNGQKELRPQDSVPFLRRISADFRKVDIKSLHAAISAVSEAQEPASPPAHPRAGATPLLTDVGRSTSSPHPATHSRPDLLSTRANSVPDGWSAMKEVVMSPIAQAATSVEFPVLADLEAAVRRGSQGSVDMLRSPSIAATSPHGAPRLPGAADPSLLDLNAFQDWPSAEPAKAHAFVKSTFSKAVQCRICRDPVKKHAVLCEECGLICHASCARHAPHACNLRAQLLMFAGRDSQDLTRGISPAPSLGAPRTLSPAPSTATGGQSPAFGPAAFRLPFASKMKRNSKGATEMSASPAAGVSANPPVGDAPAPSHASSPPPAAETRKRRISLLPGMGIGKARSPSPASRPPTAAQIESTSIPRSFSSAQRGKADGRSASVVNFGSMSGASSISSGSQAMAQTSSAASNTADGPAIQRHASHHGAPPSAHRPARGHRINHSAAVSTPHLNNLVASHSRQSESDVDMRLRQRLGSFNSGVRLASTGSKMSGHSGEGTIIDHDAVAADRPRLRRLSMKASDEKCVVA